MYKTTIMLPLDLKTLVEREAERRGVSLGEIIRIALKRMIAPSKKKKGHDSLFDFDVVYKGSCEEDLSAHHDKYLYG